MALIASTSEDILREKQVIEEAYAATLNPERLEEFEAFWESYLDAGLQNGDQKSPPASLATISLHISRAMEILERMRHTHVAESNAQKIVDSNYGFGFIVNRQGKIIARNSDALAIIPKADMLSDIELDLHGLSEINTYLSGRFKSDKKDVLFINVYLGAEEVSTCLFITPVDLKQSQTSEPDTFFLVTSVEFDLDPEAAKLIQNAFSLSASEAEIAFCLASGKSPKDISELRGSSILTVRTQIKHLIDKTDSKDIPDVVRKICNMSTRFSAVTSQIKRAENSFQTESYAKVGSLTLRDGRFMEYIEQGHPHGRPVIHIHSLMNGPKQSDAAAQLAVLRNWRFISPSRAGYGNSDRNLETGIHGNLNSTAADVAELVNHLGLKDVIVIGSIYAQKFAFKFPDLVRHFVCVNKVPTWHIDELQYLQRRQRNMIKTSMYTPMLSKFPARLAKILIDTGREMFFFRGLSSTNSKYDMKALDAPEQFQVLVDGMKHSVAQGVDAFTMDVQAHHTDWTEDAKQLQMPVTIVFGSETTMQTKFGLDRYLSAVPNAKVIEIEKAGLYLPITHFEKILDILDGL